MREFNAVLLVLVTVCGCIPAQLTVEEGIEDILPASEYSEWQLTEYSKYLESILTDDLHKDGNIRVSFPRKLTSQDFILSNGRIARYHMPTQHYGFYNTVLFHEKDDELFGVFQIFAPAMDITFDFSGRCGSGTCGGSFVVTLMHSPVQLSIDIGRFGGGRCIVDRTNHDVFYFYNRDLDVKVDFSPDGGEQRKVGEKILTTIYSSWVSNLYRIAFEAKLEALSKSIKQNFVRAPQNFPLFGKVCHTIS